MTRKIALLLILAFLSAASCTRAEKGAETGASAPNFTLQNLDGGNVTLRDLKGKVVLIEFWATWCTPCRISIPAVEKIYAVYHARGLDVLGISLDGGDWDSVKAFRNEFGIAYPILQGNESVFQKYMVRTIPMFVLLDREGNIRHRFLGAGNEEEMEKEIKTLLGPKTS